MGIFLAFSICILMVYGIIILRYYWAIGTLKLNIVPIGNPPGISVVIALKNEASNIPELLVSLENLNYLGEFEIILINDHSTDETAQLLDSISSVNVITLLNRGDGKKDALNTGIGRAKFNWIAVTDADCVMSPEWLNAMASNTYENVNMILGPVFIKPMESDFLDLQKIEFYGLQGATAGSAAMGKPISANGANMLFRKDIFEELNPYAENYQLKTGDDQFLMMAMQKKHPGSMTYAFLQDAIVRTHPVKEFQKYWEQRIRWASKGSSYTDWNILITGMGVFLVSLISIVAIVYCLWAPNYLLLIFILGKMVVDYFLVQRMAKFVGEWLNPFHFFISGIIYPFVVVGSVLGGYLNK